MALENLQLKCLLKVIWSFEYAQKAKLSIWKAPKIEAMQLLSILELYQKQCTQLKNKIEGENALGQPSKMVILSLKNSLKHLEKEIQKIELSLEEIVKAEN